MKQSKTTEANNIGLFRNSYLLLKVYKNLFFSCFLIKNKIVNLFKKKWLLLTFKSIK